MSEYVFRRLQPSDSERIIALWQEIFEDSRLLVESFLERLFDNGAGFGAFSGELLAGMAFVMTELTLADAVKSTPCGYIYAVATAEGHRRRGIAEMLCRSCVEEAELLGCEAILVKPAGDALYSYYSRVIGTENILYCRKEIINAADNTETLPAVESVSASEYYRMREEVLSALPHLSVCEDWLGFEKELCRESGGDFFSVGGSPAAAYFEDDIISVKELLCPETEKVPKTEALCRSLGGSAAGLCTSSLSGERHLACDLEAISPVTHFGIIFD